MERNAVHFSHGRMRSVPSPLWGEGRGEGKADITDFQQGYRNHFTATPWTVPYRPLLKHPKPRILGSQSAVVTGPAGEEIHCDQYGRVKVQFFWDREGQADDQTSCWLRVSSSWAGDRYGAIAIPRIGMEVPVTFLEGDPDQPLVTGCLYHKEHVVPYDLPANKTRSVFKTLSSPGGGGYNEIRIEDKKGAEQIYMRVYIRWLAAIWKPYQARLQQLNEEEDQLRGGALGNITGMLGISRESAAERQAREQGLQAISQERAQLRANLGWLEAVNEEATDMLAALNNPVRGWRAAGTREQADLWVVLLSAWFDEPSRAISEPIHRLFGHFVHDRLAVGVAQRSVKQLSGQEFFDIRGFDLPI